MGLFKPKWENKDKDKALAYIRKEADENKLLEASLNSPHLAVRVEAARKLKSDDNILKYLSEEHASLDVKKELMPRLSNRSLLDRFYNDPELYVRFFARKYTGKDDEAYQELVKEMDSAKGYVFDVLPYIPDLSEKQAVRVLKHLKAVMTQPEIDAFRALLADEKQFQQDMLEIATNAKCEVTRRNASYQITIPEIKERYKSYLDHERQEREANKRAKERAKKAEILRRLKHDDLERDAASLALMDIDDIGTLKELAEGAKSKYVRYKACRKSGGHIFDEKAPEKERCKCIVCGIIEHEGCPNNCEAWTCKRCHANIDTIPFVAGLPYSKIRFSDGEERTIVGYHGHQALDD